MSGTITSVGWDDATGGVFLAVTGMQPGQRVARLQRNGQVALLHQTDLATGAVSVADWQPPLGENVTYLILPTSASAPGQAVFSVSAFVPGGNAYLRRLNNPLLVTKVRVTDTGTEGEEVRATTFDISGRRAPLVVFNSRSARRGTFKLLTVTRDERDAIEVIAADGSPLLFNMCSSKAFKALQAAIGDIRWTRVGTKDTWFDCEMDYTEVEDGDWIGEAADYLPPAFHALKYDEIRTLTYQQVFDKYIRYVNIATGTSV